MTIVTAMPDKKNDKKVTVQKLKKSMFLQPPVVKPWTRKQRLAQVFISVLAIFLVAALFQYNVRKPIAWQEVLFPIASPPVINDFQLKQANGNAGFPYSQATKTLVYFTSIECCEADLRRLVQATQTIDTAKLGLSIIYTGPIKQGLTYFKNLTDIPVFYQTNNSAGIRPTIYPTTWLMNQQGELLAVREGLVDWHHPNTQKALQNLAVQQNIMDF